MTYEQINLNKLDEVKIYVNKIKKFQLCQCRVRFSSLLVPSITILSINLVVPNLAAKDMQTP